MLNFLTYSQLADERLIQTLLVNEYALLTDKLTMWDNKGHNNPVWKSGPTITAGSNKEDSILDDVPYSIGISSNSSAIIEKIMSTIPRNSNGAKPLKLEIESEKILSVLIITMQFSLLEYYEIGLYENELLNGKLHFIDNQTYSIKEFEERGIDNLRKGRINHLVSVYARQGIKKRINSWLKLNNLILETNDLELYEKLSKRRNKLTHEVEYQQPSIEEAIAYYENCKLLAGKIGKSLNDKYLL